MNQRKSKRFAELWTKVLRYTTLFLHLRIIPFIGHSSVVIIWCVCIITSFVHALTHTHSLRDEDASKFSLFAILSCTFIYCVFIYYIICFGIRVFLGVTKSMSENGIKNHQAPNTKMTERATAEGEFARREVGVGGSYKMQERRRKMCIHREKFLFLPRMSEHTGHCQLVILSSHTHSHLLSHSHSQNPHIFCKRKLCWLAYYGTLARTQYIVQKLNFPLIPWH